MFVCVTQLLGPSSSESTSALYVSRKPQPLSPLGKEESKVDDSAYLRAKNTSRSAAPGPDTKALGCKTLRELPRGVGLQSLSYWIEASQHNGPLRSEESPPLDRNSCARRSNNGALPARTVLAGPAGPDCWRRTNARLQHPHASFFFLRGIKRNPPLMHRPPDEWWMITRTGVTACFVHECLQGSTGAISCYILSLVQVQML